MKRVMIDMDGVLADFIKGFTMLAWTMYGTESYNVFEQETWDGFKGLDKKQVGAVWDALHKNPKFWETLPLCTDKDTFADIQRMIDAGTHDFYFVTNRSSKGAKGQTERWLNGYGIVNPTVITTAKKGEVAKALGIHYSLEDKSENADCITWLTDNKTQSFILSRPYNSGVHAPHSNKVQRVNTVDRFLTVVRGAKDSLTASDIVRAREVLLNNIDFSPFMTWPRI